MENFSPIELVTMTQNIIIVMKRIIRERNQAFPNGLDKTKSTQGEIREFTRFTVGLKNTFMRVVKDFGENFAVQCFEMAIDEKPLDGMILDATMVKILMKHGIEDGEIHSVLTYTK
jgi:hypothetical protein